MKYRLHMGDCDACPRRVALFCLALLCAGCAGCALAPDALVVGTRTDAQNRYDGMEASLEFRNPFKPLPVRAAP